jgi:hypothetical protein
MGMGMGVGAPAGFASWALAVQATSAMVKRESNGRFILLSLHDSLKPVEISTEFFIRAGKNWRIGREW